MLQAHSWLGNNNSSIKQGPSPVTEQPVNYGTPHRPLGLKRSDWFVCSRKKFTHLSWSGNVLEPFFAYSVHEDKSPQPPHIKINPE